MSFWKFQTKFLVKHFRSLLMVLAIVLISLVANRAFFADTLYKGDDFTHHALRTGSYYLALKQGQFPVRWGPNLNQGFGYPSFNYMYHTPYLLGSFFHAVGLSIQQSLNIVILLSTVGMGVFSFIFFKIITRSHRLGLLLSLLYSFNPYILLTIYWRGAVGEILFYMAVPLFLLFVTKILKKQSIPNLLSLSLITAFLVLSHIPSLLLLGLITVIFLYTNLRKYLTKSSLLHLFLAGLLGIGLSTWYLLPAIFERDLVNYVSAGSLTQYQTQFISLLQVFKVFSSASTSDLFNQVVQIGFPTALIIIFAIWFLIKNSFSQKRTLAIWLAFLTISILLTTPITESFWNTCKLIPYVQFPWRFLWPAIFAASMIAMSIFKSKKITLKFKFIFYVSLLILISISAGKYIQIKGTEPRTDFEWFHPTFETGSSFDEHQPITAQFPYEFENEILYAPVTATISAERVKNANEVVNNVYNTGTTISFDTNNDEDIVVIVKRLFYPGWEARLEEIPTEIIKNTPDYEGVISILVPASTNSATISFTGTTKIRTIANTLSAVATIIYFSLLAYYLKNLHTKKSSKESRE